MIFEGEPHVRALVDAVRAALQPFNVPVELGVAPAGDHPSGVVVLYPDPGDVEAARLCGDRSSAVIHIGVHAIGTGPEQALWAADKARTAMLGDPPAVEGRRTHRMTQSDAGALDRDGTVQPPLYVQASEYRWFSQPA